MMTGINRPTLRLDREPVSLSRQRGAGRVVSRVTLLAILIVGGAFCLRGRGAKHWVGSHLLPKQTIAVKLLTPTIGQSRPTDGEDNVLPESPIVLSINLPNGKLDKSTLLPANVSLVSEEDGSPVSVAYSASPGGGTVTLQPEVPLSPSTPYALHVTGGLKDVHGTSVAPYYASFSTAAAGKKAAASLRFERIRLGDSVSVPWTCVNIGPDHKLYASADDGRIFRWDIKSDGTIEKCEVIKSLQDANDGPRLVSGFCFDPASTPDAPILWVSNSFYAFENAPDWTGKITRMSGPGFNRVEDVVVDLPRSYRDHLTNQPSFGPDGALYFPQGSSSAYGAPDATWGNRVEHLLNATVLRLDTTKITPGHPIDVKTPDGGGSYDPSAPEAPLTIYATGIRNAFDLVWHSNGHLYVPTNGSSPGGNTPAGGGAPGLVNLPISEDDWLFKITPGKYYGHPNPAQGHYVLNGGNPAGKSRLPGRIPQYPVGTNPDPNWEPAAYVFGKHVSANGVIEYRGSAFGGALDHTLMVCRYNVGSDIIVLSVDKEGNVTQAMTGVGGLSGFTNPLDITEDPGSGNLYICEYGGKRIWLLRARQ